MRKFALGLAVTCLYGTTLFANMHDDTWLTVKSKNSPFTTHSTTIQARSFTQIPLQHIAADSAIIQLKKNSLIEKGVTLVALHHPTQIGCMASHQQCRQLKTWVKIFDRSQPQITLRAKIISIDRDKVQSLGLDFKTITQGTDGLHYNMPHASTLDGSALITLARSGNNQLLTMEISALEKSGHARIISQPSLITKDQQAAIIESGEEVPYQQNTSSGATNIAFKKAVLRLKVTPHVINSDDIDCRIDIHQDKVTPINVNGVPIIHTQHIQTHARIHNKHTLVLGGIIINSKENSLQSIPGISHIPLLGKLLSHKDHQQKQQELYIFITPTLSST